MVGYSASFARVKALIAHNAGICQNIVTSGLAIHGIEQSELHEHIKVRRLNKKKVDRGAISQALKHLVRDWAPEGDQERNATFPLILDTVLVHIPSSCRGVDFGRVLSLELRGSLQLQYFGSKHVCVPCRILGGATLGLKFLQTTLIRHSVALIAVQGFLKWLAIQARIYKWADGRTWVCSLIAMSSVK